MQIRWGGLFNFIWNDLIIVPFLDVIKNYIDLSHKINQYFKRILF